MENEKKQKKEEPAEEGQEIVRSEIKEYLDVRQQRRWIFPRAALVGLISGLIALAFRTLLSWSDILRGDLVAWSGNFPAIGWLAPVLLGLVGASLSVMAVRRLAPETAGSGIPHLEAVLHRFRSLDWKRVLPVKFFGGVLAIGGGLALGREGPTVQMGGAIGDAVSRWLKVTERERLTLISAGAGAGLSAAFNAPLSGLIFVLEEVRRDFQPIVFGATFVAAVIADIVARLGFGQSSVFGVPAYPTPPLGALPVFAVLGGLAGLLGVVFNRGLMSSVKNYARIPARMVIPAAALTGALTGLVGWFAPQLIGTGHNLAESTLEGSVALAIIPLFFLVRFLLTTTSYGSGAPGGIFAPLLVLGALLGLAVGKISNSISPAIVPIPAVFAVVGMAAYFTAIVRAPLTGIMLIVEMTGNYALMLPLLVSCFCAYIVAEALKDMPIYEALLERDLEKGANAIVLKDPAVVDFLIHAEAPFAGRRIAALGLPAGCLLVRCSDGKREWVPKATTRLEAHMRITAVIAPDAAESLEVLRRGCTKSGFG